MKYVLIVLALAIQFSCQSKKKNGEDGSNRRLLTGREMGLAILPMDGDWKIVEVSCDKKLTNGQKSIIDALNEKYKGKTIQVYDGYFRFDELRVKYQYFAQRLILEFQEANPIAQTFGVVDFDDQTLTFLGFNPTPHKLKENLPEQAKDDFDKVTEDIKNLSEDVVGKDTFPRNAGIDIPESMSDSEWRRYSYAGPFILRDVVIKFEKVSGAKLEGEIHYD